MRRRSNTRRRTTLAAATLAIGLLGSGVSSGRVHVGGQTRSLHVDRHGRLRIVVPVDTASSAPTTVTIR